MWGQGLFSVLFGVLVLLGIMDWEDSVPLPPQHNSSNEKAHSVIAETSEKLVMICQGHVPGAGAAGMLGTSQAFLNGGVGPTLSGSSGASSRSLTDLQGIGGSSEHLNLGGAGNGSGGVVEGGDELSSPPVGSSLPGSSLPGSAGGGGSSLPGSAGGGGSSVPLGGATPLQRVV